MRVSFRAFIGPAVVGAAVWCAAGAITVALPDAASARHAVPAPWWLFVLAVAAAGLLPAWRRRPVLATPAIVSTVPWWPIPLPPVALVWTGPLAWLPVAASLACAVGVAPLAAVSRLLASTPAWRSTVLAAAATFAAGAAVASNVDGHVPGGDEPHYLVITQSLLADGDLRIENNHRQRDYAAYFGGEIAPHYVRRGSDGEIYSIHAPGLPALVLPAFALFGYRGAQVLLLLLAAITGALVWRIGWRTTEDALAAWFAWTAIVGSATFLFHSFAVFPDAPGALAVAAATLTLLRLRLAPDDVGVRELVTVSILLAALPWLHTRFAVLAVGLGLLFLVQWRRHASRARAALFLAAPTISAVCWFGFFQWIYGTPNPTAPYGSDTSTHAAYVPGGLAGLLMDQQFGLFMHAPVLWLAVVGWIGLEHRATRRVALATGLVAAAYLAAVASYWLWWAGSPANPARFAVAALPAGAMPLAAAWHAADGIRRRVCLTLLAISLAITAILVVGAAGGHLAWNMRDAQALWLGWLGPVVNLPRAWPSFFWALDPGALRTEVPFVVHALVWMGVFLGGWILMEAYGRRRPWSPQGWRLAVCGWLLAGLMAAAQTGWWLNDVTGLDAAPSQGAVLSASVRRAVRAIGPLSVRSVSSLAGEIRMRGDEAGRMGGAPPWLAIGPLPAGSYALQISTPRPRAGELAVWIAGGRNAIETIRLRPENRQRAELSLPVGVSELRLVPSRELDGITGLVELAPVRLEALLAGGPHARQSAAYGATLVFFLDANVFVEAEGFWVKGGTSAALVLQRRSGDPAPTLVLQNGRGSNTVVVEAGESSWRVPLGSFETCRVELPAPSAGLVQVTVTSPSGFRPSDDGASADERYLGVWVQVE